jgi:hypothetical protein
VIAQQEIARLVLKLKLNAEDELAASCQPMLMLPAATMIG